MMFLNMVFVHLAIALHIANLIFGILFHKKLNKMLSRESLFLSISLFLNHIVITVVYMVLRTLNNDSSVFDSSFLIAYYVLGYTLTLAFIVVRRGFFIISNQTHKIKNAYLILTTVLYPLIVAGLFLMIKDPITNFIISLSCLILSLLLQLVNIISIKLQIKKKNLTIKSSHLKILVKILLISSLVLLPLVILALTGELINSMNVTDFTAKVRLKISFDHGLSLLTHFAFQGYHITFALFSIITLVRLFFHPEKSLEKYLTLSFINKYGLSAREVEITQCILVGLKNPEILGKLFIANGTLRNHITNIFQKCEVSTREELKELIKGAPVIEV